MLPACGTEEATDYKPDHRAIWLPIALDHISQGFRGQPTTRSPPYRIALSAHLEAKATHTGAWTQSLVDKDVEKLWPRCRAEYALGSIGFLVGSRGSLLTLLLGRRRSVSFFDWPPFADTDSTSGLLLGLPAATRNDT
eukprot:1139343-Amphidinium_carterae.1